MLQRYGFQILASIERIFIQNADGGRKSNVLQRSAVCKSMRADGFHAFADRDRFQGCAILESAGADDLDALADDDFLEVGITCKCAFRNHGDAVGDDEYTVCVCLSDTRDQYTAINRISFLGLVARVLGRGVLGGGIVVARGEASKCHTDA